MALFSDKTRSRLLLIVLLLSTILSGCLWFSTVSSATTKTTEVWDLNHYLLSKTLTIDGIEDNLSGITYHPDSGHLYGIINNPEQIVVISKNGQLLRKIDLIGFSDTESIDYVGGDRFIVSEERQQTISFVDIHDTTTEVHYSDVKTLALLPPEKANKGIEGIAFSSQHGVFFVQEKPARIMHFALESDKQNNQFDVMKNLRLEVGDFSGLTLLQGQDERLLVLSDDSNSLHVIDLAGQEKSRIRLGSGPYRLWPKMAQPEGVTTDAEGNIYIVGEPNQFMVLTRTRPL
ncbi:MAG: SdiA-regulated domain-containing protein [Methylophaga sp.]|uniref:SdiA-regulated domain-containing protein n=1 Tax=Methylophaga sp. TaxID=2024840 RepID=UPI00216DBECB|nr:SdiA-regulated domain-containing protein [Methylophaga sp.]MBL1458491.1 SdiA-regulated domain-containing protein [Methylophaga sp.]